jgi:hypothetical protein
MTGSGSIKLVAEGCGNKCNMDEFREAYKKSWGDMAKVM